MSTQPNSQVILDSCSRTLNGIVCKFTGADGSLGWCSEWAQVDALVDAGLLTRKHYGPNSWGHVSYFLSAGTGQ